MATLDELADQIEQFDGVLANGDDVISAVLRQNNIGGDRAKRMCRQLNVRLWDRKVQREQGERRARIDALHDASCGWLNR